MASIIPEPGHHSWAELLKLVDAVRALAYNRSLAPEDAMRRIRDAFGVYDGLFDDEGHRGGTASCPRRCGLPQWA